MPLASKVQFMISDDGNTELYTRGYMWFVGYGTLVECFEYQDDAVAFFLAEI